MSGITVELSELDADLWDAFKRGGAWVAHSEYMKLKAENAKLRELAKRMSDRVNFECRCCSVFCSDWDEDNECCVFTTLMRELGVDA